MSNMPLFLHTVPLQVNILHSKLIADHKNLLPKGSDSMFYICLALLNFSKFLS